MSKGELRKVILDECPDDFRDELSCWIDDVESLLYQALDNFDINGIDELHKIDDAKSDIEKIHEGLY